jgi:hypothetical protein
MNGRSVVDKPITTPEFERRLRVLCLSGFGPSLPKRRRDRLIILKSVVLSLGHGREYSEAEVNDALRSWLAAVGPGIRVDHVSLRRHLVDEGYITRDAAGHLYTVCASEGSPGEFEPMVDEVDTLGAVRQAQEEREERRRRHKADRAPS